MCHTCVPRMTGIFIYSRCVLAGPGTYEPDVSPTRRSPPKQSMAPKAASYFDVFMDPSRQPSPGPVYLPKERDRWGRTTIGEGPHATFPR